MKLTQQQLESLLANARPDHRGRNLYATCPYCGHDEFGISLDNDHAFGCFRKKQCGVTGNIYTLLSFLGKSKEFLGQRSVNVFDKLTTTLQGVDVVDEQIELPEIQPPLLWQRVYEDTYLRQRGFVDHQFHKFEVGRSRLSRDYVTFLIRQDGRLVGFIGRSDKTKQQIDSINIVRRQKGEQEYLRYKNSVTDFALMLFGYDEIVDGITEDVILVEGVFSKTKTDCNLGLDFRSDIKCCATFGAKLSDHQLLLLRRKGVKRLIFWFEADVLNKIKPLVSKASSHFEVIVCYLAGRDPNDIDEQQAMQLLESGTNWLNFNMSYVANDLRTE